MMPINTNCLSSYLIKHITIPLRLSKVAFAVFGTLLMTISMNAGAMPIQTYDSGVLEFSTVNQNMWGEGAATQLQDDKFFGAEWTGKTASLGGIIGSETSTTVYTNPGWWVWKACKETINIGCGGQPSTGAETLTVDTRTGAKMDLTTSGKFGFELGYLVDAGSVNADVLFNASAELPTHNVKPGTAIDLNTSSILSDGLLTTQSPTAKAYLNAIASLNATVTAKGCLIALGCKEGSATLADFNETLPLLEVNPNALEILPEALPPKNPGGDREPLLKADLFNQQLTLQASLDAAGVPGFKLSTNFGTLVDTSPTGVPSVEIDLASLEFQVPEIQASGGVDGDLIKAEGRDDFLKLKADLDGVATLGGVVPPLGLGISLIDIGSGVTNFKVAASLDVLDIDVGPDLGFAQDFELKPTLKALVNFSVPVMIAGLLVDSWEGIWDNFPVITLIKTTTFSPTFMVDAELLHQLAIDLGLSGTLDLFKVGLTASLGSVKLLGGDISLNQILGLGNTLFQTPRAEFEIYNNEFALGGFANIAGTPFTIDVPEPATLLLLLLGFLGIAAHRVRVNLA